MTANVAIVPKQDREAIEDTLLIEPFFRKRSNAVRILRLKSLPERRAVADAYAEIGCLRCQTKARPHAACGLCTTCRRWYANLLRRKIRERAKGELE